MDILLFAISFLVAAVVAWKAVDWLEPYHAGKAAAFAMIAVLIVPPVLRFVIAMTVEEGDDGAFDTLFMLSPMVFVCGSKITCAMLAVLAWCGGEKMLQV